MPTHQQQPLLTQQMQTHFQTVQSLMERNKNNKVKQTDQKLHSKGSTTMSNSILTTNIKSEKANVVGLKVEEQRSQH